MRIARNFSIVGAIFFLASTGQPSQAAFLNVINPGFELPGGRQASLEGWTGEGPGFFWGFASGAEGTIAPPPGTDIGRWSAYTEGVASGSQVISGHLIAPNSVYTLRVLVGGGRYNPSPTGGGTLFAFGGSRIELFDADTSTTLAEYVLHRGDDNPAIVAEFELQTVSFSVESNATAIGHRLGIRLTGLGERSDLASQTWFENVSLEFANAAVPEPASLAMAGLGAMGVAGIALRRRRA
jgi:hypothetical protein